MTWYCYTSLSTLHPLLDEMAQMALLQQMAQRPGKRYKRNIRVPPTIAVRSTAGEVRYYGGVCRGVAPPVPAVLRLSPMPLATPGTAKGRPTETSTFRRSCLMVPAKSDVMTSLLPQRASSGVFLVSPSRRRRPDDDALALGGRMRRSSELQTEPIISCVGEMRSIRVAVSNVLSCELILDRVHLITCGAAVELSPVTVLVPPSGSQEVTFEVNMTPTECGLVRILGLRFSLARLEMHQLMVNHTDDLSPHLDRMKETHALMDDVGAPLLTCLEKSAVASVEVIPAMPLLQASVEALASDVSDSTEANAPLKASQAAGGAAFPMWIGIEKQQLQFWDGQEVILGIHASNISKIPIREFHVSLEHPDPNAGRDEKESIASHFKLKLPPSVRNSPLAEGDEGDESESVEDAAVLPPFKSVRISIKCQASTRIHECVARIRYSCSRRTEFFREISIPIQLDVKAGIQIRPGSLRILSGTSFDWEAALAGMRHCGFISPKLAQSLSVRSVVRKVGGDGTSASMETGCSSPTSPALPGERRFVSKFDNPQAIISMDLENQSNVPFEIWSDGIDRKQTSCIVQPHDNTPRWTVGIDRFPLPFETLTARVREIDRKLRIRWMRQPSHCGRIRIRADHFARRFSDDTSMHKHFTWLELPRFQFAVSVCGAVAEASPKPMERGTSPSSQLIPEGVRGLLGQNDPTVGGVSPITTGRTYRIPPQTAVRVEVQVTPMREETLPDCTLLMLPFAFAEQGILRIPSGLAWFGTLERSVSIPLASKECLTLLATTAGESILCVALVCWQDGEIWWHHKPLCLSCETLAA
eukprot:Polyplicarium_translucidae@DN3208_c0_g1_i1.p1